MAGPGVTEQQLDRAVESLRKELTAGLTTAGVQIGAVEKTLTEKLSSLRAWGVAALVGGQALAGLASAVISARGGDPSAPVRAAAELITSLPLL